jgi:hypothetical protein
VQENPHRRAINELEMWQADTFDPKTIDKELDPTKIGRGKTPAG